MKDPNNIEKQIQSQLENREIPVSENAWEHLSQMMEEKAEVSSETPKSKFLRNLRIPLSIAASVVLLIGIYFGKELFPSEIEKQNTIVSTGNTEVQNENEPDEIPSSETTFVQKDNETKSQIEELIIPSKRKVEQKTKPEMVSNSYLESPLQEIEINLPVKEKSNANPNLEKEMETKSIIALHSDSIPKTKQKTNYVDPEMLLYSIENNQAVQEKNSGSRMVIIDFNK